MNELKSRLRLFGILRLIPFLVASLFVAGCGGGGTAEGRAAVTFSQNAPPTSNRTVVINGQDAAPGEVIVTFRDASSQDTERRSAADLVRRYSLNTTVYTQLEKLGSYIFTVPEQRDLESLLKLLKADPAVAAADPDFIFHTD